MSDCNGLMIPSENIDLNSQTRFDGFTGFHLACINGRLEIAEMLIQKSLDFNIELNAEDEVLGDTAFHVACRYGQSKIVEMLLQNPIKVDLTAKNRNGETGFQLAERCGRKEIVNLIMEKMPSLLPSNLHSF